VFFTEGYRNFNTTDASRTTLPFDFLTPGEICQNAGIGAGYPGSVDHPGKRVPAAAAAARVVALDASLEDCLALARAVRSGESGFLSVAGAEVDPELALDWWLRAARLPRFGWSSGGRVAAFAVAAPPDAQPPAWARARWLAAAAHNGAAGPAWRILRQLAASERHRPSAQHFFVPVLAVAVDAGGAVGARPLLEAVQRSSAAHPTSAGVCFEAADSAAAAPLEGLGYRPAGRFGVGGTRRIALFRPDAPFPDADGDAVVIPIEDSIDLHRFRPVEIADVVAAYVEAAWEAGLPEVRIIHGRGKGVQRHRVQKLLASSPRVERFADAPADRGGRGATIAWLSVRQGKGGGGPLAGERTGLR
jgi:hypothetical protein